MKHLKLVIHLKNHQILVIPITLVNELQKNYEKSKRRIMKEIRNMIVNYNWCTVQNIDLLTINCNEITYFNFIEEELNDADEEDWLFSM